MPRKTATTAQAEELAARRAKIRFLLRNPAFRSDYNRLRRPEVDEAGRYHRVNNSQYIGEMTAFCAKWGLENVSFSLLLRGPDESVTADDIAAFEALLAADGPHSPLYPAVGSRFERVRISVDRDRSDRRIVISWIGRS